MIGAATPVNTRVEIFVIVGSPKSPVPYAARARGRGVSSCAPLRSSA